MTCMTNFDFDLFFAQANRQFIQDPKGQRYGQFLMNYLAQVHPEIVVPEEFDCFYNDNRVKVFLYYLATLDLHY